MSSPRVLLLGCVKLKHESVQAAKDLYRSPLWVARRRYAEERSEPWFIVSAHYGLLEPDEPIAPYDLALSDLPASQRRRWGKTVVDSLEKRLGGIDTRCFELHAGVAYRRILEPLLVAGGATVESPLATVRGVGTQLAWYSRHRKTERRQHASREEIAHALHDLDEAPHVVRAADWPGGLADLDTPGLYSWWVDQPGAASLSSGLGIKIATGRIYAGLTGATKWPSGVTGRNTLRKRITSNHLRGRIRGSTFRLTLASILHDQLGLTVVGPKQLTASSEETLSAWIRDHLSVAVHRFPADPLADLEHQVLARLDPPLNLDGMTATLTRLRLAELRQALIRSPST